MLRSRRTLLLLLALTAIVCVAAVPVAGALTRSTTTRVSTGPGGGNDNAQGSAFVGSTASGSKSWFETAEKLVPEDTDARVDVYERAGTTTTRVSAGLTPASGNSNAEGADVSFAGASADGSRVFFTTDEPMTADDVDTSGDVYLRTGGSTLRVSQGPAGGNGAFDAELIGFSTDGSRILVLTDEPLTVDDQDANRDLYVISAAGTERVSTGPSGGNQPLDVFGADATVFDTTGASADAAHIFFFTAERLTSDDTDAEIDLYERFAGVTTRVTQGADGVSNGNSGVKPLLTFAPTADGSKVFFFTADRLTADDQDTKIDLYQRAGGVTTRISQGPAGGNAATDVINRFDFSADGSRVVFTTREKLTANDRDSRPDIYVRSGATTTLVSTGTAAAGRSFEARPTFDVSADGRSVLFVTQERLVKADTDVRTDLYVRRGNTTTLASTGPRANAPVEVFGGATIAAAPYALSSNGRRVVFMTREKLTADDRDSKIDIYAREGTRTVRLSGGAGSKNGNGPFQADLAGASSSLARVFFITREKLTGDDTDARADVFAAAVR